MNALARPKGSSANVDGSFGNIMSETEVRAIIKARRHRDRFFGGELFADPAWDMLLEAYAARLGQRRISTTSICGAAGVPLTTALRWLNALENEQLIVRSADERDRRRIFIGLTDSAFSAMNNYFASPSSIAVI